MFKIDNPKSFERRSLLLEAMEQLESNNINCASCTGKCCTSVANSMQCSPIEAMEIIDWLKSEEILNESMTSELKNCVSKYRLDYEISTTRGVPLRRTYTCPFFNHGALGCLLKKEIKPYGCLAFNARFKKVSDGENCTTDIELLKQRDADWADLELNKNKELQNKLSLNWNKLPMPVALLDVMERLDKLKDQV
ncbi:MAG: hypothetical protein HN576_05430 [Bacteriovoracaceae bacterium]|jgi:hypothetical protein|nr:hypothetical protein [Bacteriovoracaceae bacterium]